MVSWQLFGLPRVTLPSFSQIGDGPQTPPLDLLDPIRKPLLIKGRKRFPFRSVRRQMARVGLGVGGRERKSARFDGFVSSGKNSPFGGFA